MQSKAVGTALQSHLAEERRPTGSLHLASSCVAALGDVHATPWLWPQPNSRCGPGSAALGATGPVPIIRSFTCCGAACSPPRAAERSQQLLQQPPGQGCRLAPRYTHVCEVLAGHRLTKTFLIFTLLRSSDKAPNKTTAVSTACV